MDGNTCSQDVRVQALIWLLMRQCLCFQNYLEEAITNSPIFQDYQLKQRNIENLVLGGLTANTCLESTARYAYEL